MSSSHEEILYLSFNFDNSLFAVGTEIGFKIFTTESLQLKLKRNLGGGIGLIQILGKSNIFCLCGGGKNPKYSPNKLIIYDDKKAKEINEFRFNSNIQNCKIKQEKIFIISQHKKLSIWNNRNNKNMWKYIRSMFNSKRPWKLLICMARYKHRLYRIKNIFKWKWINRRKWY